MNVIIFGASGMVGEGVLLECLDSVKVDSVTTVVRRETGREHEKLSEVIVDDPGILSSVEIDLGHLDACFWCVGISSVGLSEDDYARITYGLTVSAMETLLQLNPAMKFVFVSAVGADSTETSSTMWERVKGRTENAVLNAGFADAVVFRPAYIQPLRGVRSRTRLYRVAYVMAMPLYPLIKTLFPKFVTTTEAIGRAMIEFVASGASKPVLESEGINRLAADER